MTVEIICDNEDCNNTLKNQEGCFQVIEGKTTVEMDNEIVEQENYPGVFCSKKCLIDELACNCETFDDACSDCVQELRVKRA